MRPIQVWFEEQDCGDGCERRLIFDAVPDGPDRRVVFWWRLDTRAFAAPPVLDSFLPGPALWAARRGQDLVVNGPMTAGGAYNLGQLLAIRAGLSPERYPRVIDVQAQTIVTTQPSPARSRQAVVALSGGLDSLFTLVRHAQEAVAAASYHPACAVIIHGFDAPLDRPDAFEAMRRRATPVADELGVPMHVVVTNSKLDGGTWPQAAIPLTCGALANFSSRCGTGLVSAGAPYGVARIGISHPNVIDNLCSNDHFRLLTDGSGFGRSDKAEFLLGMPTATAAVKTCWEGNDPSRNCGVCQKCVMTRLNFLAAGDRNPACFDSPIALNHVGGLQMKNMEAVRDLFRMCWNELAARNDTSPERWLLERRLRRVPPQIVTDAVLTFRRVVGPVVRPIKQVWRGTIHWLLNAPSPVRD